MTPPKPRPDPHLDWPIPLAAVELIADAEGLSQRAYRCPAGITTIGWGQTQDVQPGMAWTKEQCDSDLCNTLRARCKQVLAACTEYPTANELGALVSLQYNIGHGAFLQSSVLRAHNASDRQSASRAFGLFNKARVNGVLQELRGLTSRRAAEAALYLRPDEGSPPLRMPQAVEPESKLGASPIAQTGVVAVGVGAAGTIAQASEHVGLVAPILARMRDVVVGSLGLSSAWVMPALLVVMGGVIVWQRYKQRIKGWA